MKYKSALVTAASGSIGGLTAAHNRGGMYLRSRSTPVNPNSPGQQAVRSFLSNLSFYWYNLLTSAQQVAWQTYAELVAIVDTLGEPRFATGLNHYIRSNTPRLRAGKARIDNGPTIYTQAELTALEATIQAGGTTVQLGFENTDTWANEAGGHLIVYASRPTNASRNFFKGPYQFMGTVNGAATPPTSPATLTLPFPVVAGQRVHFMGRASTADGRLSPPFRISDDL